MNATARKKGNMKKSLAVRRSIGIQWEETQWACAIRKKRVLREDPIKAWEHAAAVVVLMLWRFNEVASGVGMQSAKAGPAATGQATNDF